MIWRFLWVPIVQLFAERPLKINIHWFPHFCRAFFFFFWRRSVLGNGRFQGLDESSSHFTLMESHCSFQFLSSMKCLVVLCHRHLFKQFNPQISDIIRLLHRYQKSQNRLLKVCCVPATSVGLPRVSFFFFSFLFLLQWPFTVLMKQTRQAIPAVKQSIYS